MMVADASTGGRGGSIKVAFEFGVILELLLVRTNPDELLGGELDGMSVRGFQLQDDQTLSVECGLLKPEHELGGQLTKQPVLEILVADLCRPWIETGADHLMVAVRYPPHHIGKWLGNRAAALARAEMYSPISTGRRS